MDNENHCTNTEHETEITRDIGGNPYSLLFIPLSLHSSFHLSVLCKKTKKKVWCDPVFLSPNRSLWLTPCQGLCSDRRGRPKELRKREQQHRLQTVRTLSLSRSLFLSALSPWCTHVDLEQGCILAGEARNRVKGVGRWGCKVCMEEGGGG